MGNQEYGTGLITSYKQLVSDQLGIDPDRIDVIMGDTDRTPAGLTGGSRALAVAGSALYEAGRTDHRQGHEARRASAGGLGAGRRLCRWKIQRARHRSSSRSARSGEGGARSRQAAGGHGARPRYDASPRAAGTDLSQRLPHRRGRDRSRTPARSPSSATPWSMISAAPSIPMMLEGQVHGGIAQGIGQALSRARGLRSGRAGNCFPARSWTTPCRAPATCRPLRSPRTTCRPRPTRSASRARARPAPSARRRRSSTPSSTRIHDRAGVRHIDMPATPSRVWAALNRSAA